MEGKKEIPLAHRDKVGTILRDAYNTLKPIIKYPIHPWMQSLISWIESLDWVWDYCLNIQFIIKVWHGTKESRLISLCLVSVASVHKITLITSNLFFSIEEEVVAFTSMIQIKIRNPESPQNPKKFLNKTSVLAILLHELAHIRHMHHGIRFALFLRQLYEYAMM